MICLKFILTLHILAAGTALNVLNRLAFTPGGGSNTNTREARSKFTGTYKHYKTKTTHKNVNLQCHQHLEFKFLHMISREAGKQQAWNLKTPITNIYAISFLSFSSRNHFFIKIV